MNPATQDLSLDATARAAERAALARATEGARGTDRASSDHASSDCATFRSECDCADVAAYLDGELSVAESAAFESHVAACPTCAGALAEQRRLLCLLDAAFSRTQKKSEPSEEFVRVVKARAQTDMTCVRRTSERRRAAVVVVALSVLSAALLGGSLTRGGLATLGAVAEAALSIGDMALHTLAEVAAGLLFILRGVGRHLATEPRGVGFLVLLLLACALAALLRLVADYHRQRLSD